MKTVTLDIDEQSEAYAMLRVFQFLRMGAKRVKKRRSSSGDGYHIKAYFNEGEPVQDRLDPLAVPIDVTYATRYVLRLIMGDDVDRLYMDAEKRNNGIHHDGVLFDTKDGKQVGEWQTYWRRELA